jgi:hypothetical protein
MSMQSGSGQRAAARQMSFFARCGRLGALLLGLTAAACANIGQIGNLTEDQRITVAFESVDGPPTAVVHKFVGMLKEEAQARQITVLSAGQADCRLRGYLAVNAGGGATAIAWVWDIYGNGQRRAFRLSGDDQIGSSGPEIWAAGDDQALRRIAQSGIQQLALFIATARPSSPAIAETPGPQRRSSTFAWLDDWTPEASGIFRIFRRGPQPEIAADSRPGLAGEVPLPKGRPAPAGASSSPAFAFAPND